MSRIYFKIFLAFWLMTITMVIGSIVAIHSFELGPDKHLTQKTNKPKAGPGGRFCVSW